MAACDYHACDLCGEKTFYDAQLDWDWDEIEGVHKTQGYRVWALCHKCNDHFEIVIKEKDQPHDQ